MSRRLFMAALAVIVAGAGYGWYRTHRMETPQKAAPVVGFETLKGRWLRADGGYILEVRNLDASGKLDAYYFNPRSIHVAKAEASMQGTTLRVFVELRDVNYPGSTYRLTYDAVSDRLVGDYFQAALNQTFDVVFERSAP